mmetsp:Transcript_11080/g.23749  ORF Transcript_11080/g.23749 Transcript_11080/m.23749 type:complete len:128 (-) Transcript_11080:45-428(-)
MRSLKPRGCPTTASDAMSHCSELLLERCHGERLDDGPGRLCLDDDLLAEDLPLASLGGRLLPGLDPAEAGQSEDAVLLHLSGGNLDNASNSLRRVLLLHLARGRKGIRKGALGHGRALHRLHLGSHL